MVTNFEHLSGNKELYDRMKFVEDLLCDGNSKEDYISTLWAMRNVLEIMMAEWVKKAGLSDANVLEYMAQRFGNNQTTVHLYGRIYALEKSGVISSVTAGLLNDIRQDCNDAVQGGLEVKNLSKEQVYRRAVSVYEKLYRTTYEFSLYGSEARANSYEGNTPVDSDVFSESRKRTQGSPILRKRLIVVGVIVFSFLLVLCLIIFFYSSRGEKHSSNANNQTNIIDSDMMNLVDVEEQKELYYKGYSENKDAFENVTNEQIQELIKNKNRDLESTNFHSENSYKAEMQTAVRIEQRNETHDFHIYTGNYYDIDEKYLYIITCRHAMIEQDYPISTISGTLEKTDSDLIKFNMTPQEICDTIHEINLIDSQGNYQTFYNYSCVISHNADIALIAIDINEVNEDILNNIKTIDISKINQDIDNTYGFLYCCRKPTVDETFVQKKIFMVTRDRGMIYFNQFFSSPTMFGNSGSGVFDENGYYLGETYNGYMMTSTAIVTELPKMFNELEYEGGHLLKAE